MKYVKWNLYYIYTVLCTVHCTPLGIYFICQYCVNTQRDLIQHVWKPCIRKKKNISVETNNYLNLLRENTKFVLTDLNKTFEREHTVS